MIRDRALVKKSAMCDVVLSRDMLNAELLALDAVLQPMEAHVDALRLRQARRDRLVGLTCKPIHVDLCRCFTLDFGLYLL